MYGGGNDSSKEARLAEEARQVRINQGLADINTKFGQFDQAFYDKQRQNYENFAMPTVAQDYNKSKGMLGYELANRGLLNSSSGVKREASLNRELSKAKRTVADQAQGSVNDLRGQVEDTRSNLINQLEASSDPAAIGSLATAQAGRYNQPLSYQPIGNLFADWTNWNLAGATANAYSGGQQGWPGLWGSNQGSSRIV